LRERVASSTDLIQATLSRGQILRLRQGALAGRPSGAIDVEDLPLDAGSIQQLASLPLFGERAGQQILQKEHTQGFDSRRGEADKKATERRAAGQLLSVEQGHEGLREGEPAVHRRLRGCVRHSWRSAIWTARKSITS